MFALNLSPEFILNTNVREPDNLHRLIKITVVCGNQREHSVFKYTPLTRKLKAKLSVWNDVRKDCSITIDNGFEKKKLSFKNIWRAKLWVTITVFKIRIDKMQETVDVKNNSEE